MPHQLEYPDIPAWGILARTTDSFPDRIASCYYREQLTYRQQHTAAIRTASALRGLGVQPGDRVGILMPNMPEYVSVLNGIWMAGATAVALSPLMVPAEVSGLLRRTDCRVVVALDLLAPLVLKGDFRPDHILFTTLKNRLPGWQRLGYAFAKVRRLGFWPAADSPNQHSLRDLQRHAERKFVPLTPETLDAPAYILATGGTTGDPKDVVLSHRNIVANAWQIYHWAGSRVGKEVMLAVLPFFHSYGLTTCLTAGTALAATLVIHHRFIPRVVLKLIETHQPTIFPTVPAMLAALNDVLRKRPHDLSSLNFCISGGATCSSEIADEFRSHSRARVVEGFGLSEASPVTHAGPLDGTERDGTIGLPLPDTDARIVDAKTGQGEVAVGEIGELIVRGPQVMLGYLNNEAATADAIRDGWLYTGDLACRDADGFFRIVDRKKDLIITSGFNVYPTDVEQVLRRYKGLRDVAVIGVPDLERGEIVKALLQLEPNAEFDRVDFDRFCRDNLSKHKVPKVVEVVDGDLPRNFLGKVLRRELRELPMTEAVAT
ncbi:MAG: AMP-binding protein [Planctomycetota bacterium]|nr:AMP-binding protein [Planctomycetota bacterium]